MSTRGLWLQGENRERFYESLRSMSRLKKLNIPYIASDQLLRIVAANCPQLVVLDLSGARELTDVGVGKW